MGLIIEIKQELKRAKESNNQNWIDSKKEKLNKAYKFFEIAKKVGLVKNGKYQDGIPGGSKKDLKEFYYLEDYLGYPDPQKLNFKTKNQ